MALGGRGWSYCLESDKLLVEFLSAVEIIVNGVLGSGGTPRRKRMFSFIFYSPTQLRRRRKEEKEDCFCIVYLFIVDGLRIWGDFVYIKAKDALGFTLYFLLQNLT